jgi:excisionase family DNA binding protein
VSTLERSRPLLRIPEVADRLAVSPATVRRLIAAGELPHVRVGRQIRFKRVELEGWLGPDREEARP